MLRPAHGVIVSTIALLAIGVVMIASAGFRPTVDAEEINLGTVLLGPTGCLALAAIAILFIVRAAPSALVSRLPRMRWLPVVLLVASLIPLALAYVPGIADPQNYSNRWIRFGPIGFQASEIAKWAVPIGLAIAIAAAPHRVQSLGRGFLPLMAVLGAVCLVIAIEDLGTAVLLGAVGTIVLIAGGARLTHVALMIPVGIAGVVALAFASPYRLVRLRTFMNPFEDVGDSGYHIVQSLAAISGGDLGGRGIGNGLRKLGYLPEDTTDFIFSVICEELGLLGAALTTALLATLILCTARLAANLRHPAERLIGVGIVATIALQSMINLLVVTGLAPTKGIALPLISRGGTGWWLTAVALGLLLAFDRARTSSWRRAHVAPESPTTKAPCAASSSPAAAPAAI